MAELNRVYAEDLVVHQRFTTRIAHTVTRDEIIDFARRWDPQSFHVDDDDAAVGHYGGLIASGLHSLALLQRLSVDLVLSRWVSVGGSALREARFPRPLRPGTPVRADVVITAIDHLREHRSRVHRRSSLIDADGDIVVDTTIENWVHRRHPKTSLEPRSRP